MLQAKEEEDMAKMGKKQQPKKVTAHELRIRAEEEEKRLQRLGTGQKMERDVREEDYASSLDVRIDNRQDRALVDAHSLTEAVEQMAIGRKSIEEDRHPEKYVCVSTTMTHCCVFILLLKNKV